MNSKLTVEIAFDLPNRPAVVQMIARRSTDTRDQIFQDFKQSFAGLSSWCKVHFAQQFREGPQHNHFDRILIEPIPGNTKEINNLAHNVFLRLGENAYLQARPKGFNNRMDMWWPAEHAVQVAVDLVEAMGAHPELTAIVIALGDIREKIGNYVVEHHKP